ncbi:MAG: RHS repeat-associated core domain-containing protein, partial [Rhodothermales bacterium]
YYDPASGAFTQQDPIGIAGGLNLYGYANGDPINFSDPFGLDPCEKSSAWTECLAQKVADWGAQRGGAAGRIALEAAAMLNGGLEATGINAVASFGDALGTALETGQGLTVSAALGGSLELFSGGKGKPTLTATKTALRQVHGIVGHLPGSARGVGRFGSPMRGDVVRGYRLDPPHPNAVPGSPEAGYHINYWDWTGGKRGSGGIWGAVSIGGS